MRRPLIVWFATLLASAALAAESRYALILEDPPIAKTVHSRKALRTQAALDARARIEAAQRKVQQQLAQRHIRVTGSVETLLNAVFVATDNPSQLQDIPGVRRVALLRQFRRHLNAALPLVQTQQAWSALASAGYPNAGAGVKIAILDTGIDQNHAAFQDPSLPTPANLPACNDFPGLAGNNDCAYTNSKVIAARSYVRMLTPLTATISRPDDESSRDRVGHGTAAAMAAAGVQNTGPLATITGMAPKAYLGNYKIFGSPGVNDTTSGDALSLALEDAVNDHMDIASLSVGFPAWYAPEDTGAACGEPAGVSCEVEAQAVEAAIGLGMAVVVSAGNDGASGLNYPALNSIHTPGTAPSAVTVGASVNGHVIYGHAGLTAADAGSLGNMDASFGDGWNARVTAPLRDVSRLGNDGLACTALASNSLGGAVALVQRGTCDFWTKAVNTRNAGAVGVLIYREANEDTPFRPLGLRGTGIPTAIIGYTNGQGLKNYLLTHPDASVTLDASTLSAYTDPEQDMAAVTSSRGPAIGDFHIKPELVAPGTSIYTATQRYDPNGDLYDPSGYAIADGTSFAAPIVAGAIAMVKQKNPGFTVAQLKSAVVNTASTGIQDEGPARVTAVGAGKLDAEAAVKTNVTCDPATVSFGVVTPAMIGASRALTIYNGSSSPVTLAVVPTTTDPSAHLELSSTTIAAGQQDTIAVYLRGTVPAPGEYEGAITITGGAVPLRVPYLYMVGDGVPANAFPIQNTDFVDLAGQPLGGSIAFKVIDQYGVPVSGAPLVWAATKGGGRIDTADSNTDRYGLAFANAQLGTPGEQELTGTVYNNNQPVLTFPFQGRARAQPVISANGVVDAASGLAPQTGQGLAPGSYIAIWGTNLGDVSIPWNSMLPPSVAPYLPILLGGVRVSFDVPSENLSVPGRLTWAGPNQVNVQIPWELAGQTSAFMKVTVGGLNSPLYTLPLRDSAPAIFEAPLGSGLAAATDPFTGAVISTSNRVRKGQWVAIYANALGPVNNTPATGEMTPAQGFATCLVTPTVTVAGLPADVNFAGLTPTGIGYYQINVRVPDNAASGNQPVIVSVNGVTAKTVNLPIE